MGLSTLKGNSGFIGIDKRNSVTGDTIGNLSLKKFFLERKKGNLVPIIPPGPSTILFEDDFSSNNLNKWNVSNGTQPSVWITGSNVKSSTSSSVVIPSGSTYSAYISSNSSSNVYNTNSRSHIYFDFDIPENTVSLSLEFDWLCYGERTSGFNDWDFGYITFSDPTQFTPSAGSYYGQSGTGFERILGSNTADNLDSGKFTGDGGDARSENTSKNNFVYENITIDNTEITTGSLWCDNCTRRITFSWVSDGSVIDDPSWTIANVKLSYNL